MSYFNKEYSGKCYITEVFTYISIVSHFPEGAVAQSVEPATPSQ